MFENVTNNEAILRFLIGMLLVVMLLVLDLTSQWIAVTAMGACYPVFTAIMKWDPLYALLDYLGEHVALVDRRYGEAAVTA